MPLSTGTRLGPYEIVAPLGAGGMGEVYCAQDTRLRRTVAIKILPQGKLADAEGKRRFLREARAASSLMHPNIVVVHDISNDELMDFMVMEHVRGETLKELIKGGVLPLGDVIRFGAEIASALAAAHSAGIVHRDVKPANIMITEEKSQVKILDFGLAQFGEPASSKVEDDTWTIETMSQPGLVMGTIAYMSPEQARGEALDGRSDIFSMGVVLYEAATGRAPFNGASALAVIYAIATATPAAPSSLRPELPKAFDRLIAACLEKDRAHRPSSAADVERELKSLSNPTDQVLIGNQPRRRSIAVIPFRFRNAVAEERFLSLTLAEAVINRLGSITELIVRPTASVLKYNGTDSEWAQVARDLKVDLVVEGTIQKLGPKIRVFVQALQVNDSRTLISFQHDGDAGDLFGLQDQITDSVYRAFLPPSEAPREPAIAPTQNPLAYELYMRAGDRVVHMNRFDTGCAIEMLTQAVEIDPNFADGWGRLAQSYAQMGMYLPDPQWFLRAEHAIAKTLELDPVHCDALCARGLILWSPSRQFQTRPALRAINAALKVSPGRVHVRQFRSAILFHLGHYDQAERDIKEALLGNPGYAMGLLTLGMIALYRGDYDSAERFYAQTLALEPANLHANIFAPCVSIYKGRLADAAALIGKGCAMVPGEPQLTSLNALISAYEGNFARAVQLADEVCSSNTASVTHTHHSWHYAAGAYALCGHTEKALAQVRRCAELGLPNYRLFLSDPNLRSLWDLPEFLSLMSEVRRLHDDLRFDIDLAATLQP